jgi:D-alanyl-lipoteichoic acid acyltransferase DltB (MBOAT superfamily)
VLPVGISFYTFQALSYVVDVYRRKIRPARHVIDFANYLAFFPQLVAGPIVRAADLLPQMEAMPGLETRINTSRAGLFILTGLFKKIVVANWLAEHLADPVFDSPEAYAAADLVLGVYAYAVQIYCDFSAYSDIAVGCALLLGFTFPFNFNAPYFAGTLQDFWRRWHISLSTWLRDYLYIPLGGSRCGPARCSANLILTFFLGGLWHGAAWTFVVWGLFHGVYLTLERPFLKRLQSLNRFWGLVAKVWLFQMVCLSWVLFRSSSWTGVTEMLRGLGRGGASELFGPQAALALLCGFAMQFLDADRAAGLERRIDALPPWVQGLTAAAILVIILGVGPQGVAPFIYFQF